MAKCTNFGIVNNDFIVQNAEKKYLKAEGYAKCVPRAGR